MELKQLEYFLAVSNAQSFTRAAEQLYISQPSVTAAIKKLEDELGLILFDRNKKQATLTSEGEIFYSHICVVMRDISKAAQKAAELKNLASGVIKIGISPLTCQSNVAFLIGRFRRLYPSLHFSFTETNTQELKNLLEDDKIDLAILLEDAALEGIISNPICKEQLFVHLPLFHPLAGRDTVSLKDLRQEMLILPQENCSCHTIISRFFAVHNFIPHIGLQTNYPSFARNLIVAGNGVAILPKGTIEVSNVLSLPLKDAPSVNFCIAKKQNKQIAHAAEKLFDFLAESYVG